MFEEYLQELRKLAEDAKDAIPGGKADKKLDDDFSPKQMAMGQQVEMEHTTDPKMAREISRDHLEEFPDYYSRLHKMEAKAEKEKKAGADDTYHCPPCGWRGKGSELKNGKCPKCGAAVELVKKASADEGGRAPTKQDKVSIREWLSRHDNAKDEDFHALAEKMGVNTHKAEAVAYDMAHELSKKGSMGQAGGIALYMSRKKKEDQTVAPQGHTMSEFLSLLKRTRPAPVKQDAKTAAEGCPGGGRMRMGPRPGMGAKRGGGRGLGPGKGKQDRSGLKYIKDRLREDPIKESHAQDLVTAGDQIGRILAKEAHARTLTGLAAGTVLGAGIGALTSEDSSSKGLARSAIIGGVAGGTLGGAIGAISEGAAAQMGEKFRQSGALNQAFQAGRADIAQEVVRGAGNKNIFQKGWQMGVSWARGGR